MYLVVLFAHSIVRWIVLGCAVWASLYAQSGLRAGRAWTRRARIPGVVLAAAVDVQFLLGISLWLFLSPHAITQGARSHYWTFAHPLLGLGVVALVHVGSVRVRRMLDDGARWRTASRYYLAALVLVVLAIPWPIAGMGRRLLPF